LKSRHLILFGLILIFGLNACDDTNVVIPDETDIPDKPLVDTQWVLQFFEIVGEGETDIGSQTIDLKFTEDGRLWGKAKTIKGDLDVPGNSYGSTYEVKDDGTLHINTAGSTYVGLPSGSRYIEYLDALRKSSSYEIEGDKLRIFYDEGTKTLIFEAE